MQVLLQPEVLTCLIFFFFFAFVEIGAIKVGQRGTEQREQL